MGDCPPPPGSGLSDSFQFPLCLRTQKLGSAQLTLAPLCSELLKWPFPCTAGSCNTQWPAQLLEPLCFEDTPTQPCLLLIILIFFSLPPCLPHTLPSSLHSFLPLFLIPSLPPSLSFSLCPSRLFPSFPFFFFLKMFSSLCFYFMCVSVLPACLHTMCVPSTFGGQKRELDPLKLE